MRCLQLHNYQNIWIRGLPWTGRSIWEVSVTRLDLVYKKLPFKNEVGGRITMQIVQIVQQVFCISFAWLKHAS